MPEALVRAEDVRACLALRWPDDQYLGVDEAPQASDRSGRKLDVVFLSLWRSRGLKLDGVEIKVSVHDWRRELGEPAKADFWWKHVNRFWVAVPEKIADTVRDELPDSWGLLSCTEGKVPKVVVKAPHHTPEPLSWSTTVGLLRAAADCGVNALHRARQEGRSEGYEAGKKAGDAGALGLQLDRLRRAVEEFEQASGVGITEYDGPRVGYAVRLVLEHHWNPQHLVESLVLPAQSARRSALALAKQAQKVEELAAVVGASAVTEAP